MKVIDYTTHEGDLPIPCAVINMPEKAYRAYKALSKSDLDLIDRSMAHYVYATPFETTRNMEIGTAIHCAMFEHERYKDEYCLLPNVKDRRASEYKQAVKIYGSELTLVGHESDKVNGMYQSVSLNPEAQEVLRKTGWSEISFFAQCPKTGETLKCRFDWLTECGLAIDLKKTQDVRYEKFQRSIAIYRYHVQHAFYDHVYELVTGKKLESFEFLCVEEMPPHANKIYALDSEAIELGHNQYDNNLKTYIEYDPEGGLPDGLVQERELISLPAWMIEDEEEVLL